ncbi:ClbS/DfsB family four-helix bundle protein [Vagococcus carniphilus]|uniref:ClbS/DfsB family four-helix bundle protein n=1 Tax=Vagococcus carniphilus TaxID=218144 RepID=UPI00288DC83E|nr:ClbS/DfsB family four-helix bundle protein [Vagococcus carniphilus]MDT2848994.1 ClbS/DfsB family four-helix bundle protein [Vagococcus carniphilus]
MARPKNKEELLQQATENFDKLMTLFNSLSDEEKRGTFTFDTRDKNCRDTFAHLYEWHQLFINWERDNSNGQAKPFLPAPYNWKNYPDMNIEFWEKHQTTSLETAVTQLEKSHQDCLQIIETYTDEELFTKKYYNWTGSTSLGSYAISATSSHYDWALKTIRKYKKSLK